MTDEVRQDPLFTPPEPAGTTEDPPPEVAPLHPELLPTLQELDQDISGEQKFCRQASESLRAFEVRWGTDVAVSDGYRSAIVALDNMHSILEGAHTRLAQEATRTVMEKVTTADMLQTAQAARDSALAWAETPPTEEPLRRDTAPVGA